MSESETGALVDGARRRLTRRGLLKGGLAALALAALHTPRAVAAALRRVRRPTLWPAEADVWATSLAVEGTPPDALLSVGGQPFGHASGMGGFSAEVPLMPGSNVVVAADPSSGLSVQRSYRARLAAGPTARASVAVANGSVRLDATGSEPDPYTGTPIESVSWRRRAGASLGSGSVLTLSGEWPEGEQYVTARVTDVHGGADETTVVFTVSGGEPAIVDPDSWQASWIADAVVYGVLPPLFGQPPLEAVTAQLGRLQALGVNVLWLSPIFATIAGDFGYAVTDYFTVRADYGDLASLRTLVVEAHARDMKVILDLPLNDTSDQHPYYLQCREDTTGSHYWGFYERTAKGKPVHYFNWRGLPNLAYAHPEVRRMASEIGAYWLREADVDGFRCDAAWGVQEREPGFWSQWRADLERIRPDLLLLAEGSARDGAWAAAGFSAAYDWTDRPGEWAWAKAFGGKGPVAPRLRAALEAPPSSRPFRFLENNDTGRRFIAVHGPGMTRAAAAMLLALPGLPCIYTGQEIGASYDPYRSTEALDWAHDPDGLEAEYRRLIAQRRADPILAGGALSLLEASPEGDVLAYMLSTSAGRRLIALNFSSGQVRAVITLEGGGTTTLQISPWSAVVSAIG